MVHGQAIGIPFRRRKGEQAPPPPKEVAWNPTIESNLPYKEVKYFKFVGGAVVAVDWFANLLLASGTVLVAMASAEYKDREHGSAFDWYDILAGMTLPVLFWVGSLIVLIVK